MSPVKSCTSQYLIIFKFWHSTKNNYNIELDVKQEHNRKRFQNKCHQGCDWQLWTKLHGRCDTLSWRACVDHLATLLWKTYQIVYHSFHLKCTSNCDRPCNQCAILPLRTCYWFLDGISNLGWTGAMRYNIHTLPWAKACVNIYITCILHVHKDGQLVFYVLYRF